MKKERRYVSHCWVVSLGTNSSIVAFPTNGISEALFPFDDSGVSNFTGISSFSRKFIYKFWGLSNYGRVPQDGHQEHPSAESPSYGEKNDSSYQRNKFPPHQKKSQSDTIYYVYT